MLNHKIIQRLMGELGLKSKIRWLCYRSYKGEVGKIAPNRKWATNVTQINIGLVKLYLSPILDMFTGEIISYNISRNPNLEQIYDMLDKAFARFDSLDGLILHVDQGWQYQHDFYHHFLEDKGIQPSMSRKGNSPDNGMKESFFDILKSEMFYGYEKMFHSLEQLEQAIVDYIDYYNNKRIKVKLKGLSSV